MSETCGIGRPPAARWGYSLPTSSRGTWATRPAVGGYVLSADRTRYELSRLLVQRKSSLNKCRASQPRSSARLDGPHPRQRLATTPPSRHPVTRRRSNRRATLERPWPHAISTQAICLLHRYYFVTTSLLHCYYAVTTTLLHRCLWVDTRSLLQRNAMLCNSLSSSGAACLLWLALLRQVLNPNSISANLLVFVYR